jgi:UDP-N-acetylmuramate dehydrogenase
MSALNQLNQQFPDLHWQSDVVLADYTYMRVGGAAEVFWEARQLDDLVKVVTFARQQEIPVLIIGGASNILIRDGGVEGLVILNHCEQGEFHENRATLQVKLQLDDSYFSHVPPEAKFLQLESGMRTSLASGLASQHSLTGLEPFIGVPGSLGGALYNNSHYQKELIGDWVVALEVLTLTNERKWLHQQECEFAYDDSRFQYSGEIILQAVLFVLPGEQLEIQDRVRESTQKRAHTQPLGTANSGCVFKNVVLTSEQSKRFEGKTTLPAGWLIDQAGLKGTRVGGAVVSPMHANFIVNDQHATSHDVEQLVALVQEKVAEKFNIQLEKEVFFLGKE